MVKIFQNTTAINKQPFTELAVMARNISHNFTVITIVGKLGIIPRLIIWRAIKYGEGSEDNGKRVFNCCSKKYFWIASLPLAVTCTGIRLSNAR